MASGSELDSLSRLLMRPLPRFFCHQCRRTFIQSRSLTDSNGVVSCPSCQSEFVEELREEEDRTVGGVYLGARGTTTEGGHLDEVSDEDPPEEDVRDFLRQNEGPATQRRRTEPESRTTGTGARRRPAGPMRIPRATIVIQHRQPQPSFAVMVQDYISRLVELRASGSNEMPERPQFRPPHVFVEIPIGGMGMGMGMGMHGHPGDYAWGAQGLDNIISQMLAGLEDNGPPPAEKEKIEALLNVDVDDEDLKACPECSVCKEPFSLGENLKKLPCEHLYHDNCVLPWLELHDTCPTCRYSINTGKPANT